MRHLLFLAALLALLAPGAAHAQTALQRPGGFEIIDASSRAQLAFFGPNGVIPPRLSITLRDAIVTPSDGQTIWNTTTTQLETWDGDSWEALSLGGNLDDGDKTDITVASSGTVWTIDDAAVDSAAVATDAIKAVHIEADAVGASEIAADAVNTSEIATGAVAGAEIANESITADDIGTDAVDSDEIAADAVGASEIATGAVGSDEIATDAVGSDEIAIGAVGTSEIATNGVDQLEIATDAVNSAEIATDAVGQDELAAGAVGDSEFDETDPELETEIEGMIDVHELQGAANVFYADSLNRASKLLVFDKCVVSPGLAYDWNPKECPDLRVALSGTTGQTLVLDLDTDYTGGTLDGRGSASVTFQQPAGGGIGVTWDSAIVWDTDADVANTDYELPDDTADAVTVFVCLIIGQEPFCARWGVADR